MASTKRPDGGPPGDEGGSKRRRQGTLPGLMPLGQKADGAATSPHDSPTKPGSVDVSIIDDPSTADTITKRFDAAEHISLEDTPIMDITALVVDDSDSSGVRQAPARLAPADGGTGARIRPPTVPKKAPPPPRKPAPSAPSLAARAIAKPITTPPVVGSSAPPRSVIQASARTARDLRAGSSLRASFSGYELLMPLAKGGMAAVWAARLRGSSGFQRVVAVKTLLPEVSDNPDFHAMLLDEARVAARIRHPNVTDLLDFGRDGELLYLVMEWIEGDTLAGLRKLSKPLGGIPLPIILRVAIEACSGLHAAHELRDEQGALLELVHRDISPSNVLVAADGFAKLLDFGIAKSKARLYWTSDGGLVKGKASYLSPEQVRGDPIDRRSDIFSFGTMMYVLTTGRHPFRDDHELKTAENIAARQPPAPSSLVAGLSTKIDRLILRALEKDASRRYQTALELQRALEECATAVGSPATGADVGAFVQKIMGERLVRRAAKLRAIIAALDEAERLRSSQRPAAMAVAEDSVAVGTNEELWVQDEDDATLEGVPNAPAAVAASVPVVAAAALDGAALDDEPQPRLSRARRDWAADDMRTDTMLQALVRDRRRRFVSVGVGLAAIVGVAAIAVALSNGADTPTGASPTSALAAETAPAPPVATTPPIATPPPPAAAPVVAETAPAPAVTEPPEAPAATAKATEPTRVAPRPAARPPPADRDSSRPPRRSSTPLGPSSTESSPPPRKYNPTDI